MAILQPPRSRFMIADILTESAAAAAAVNASMFLREEKERQFNQHASAYFQQQLRAAAVASSENSSRHLLNGATGSESHRDDINLNDESGRSSVNDENDESDSESCEPVDSDGKFLICDTLLGCFQRFSF